MQIPSRPRPVIVVVLSEDSSTIFTQEMPDNDKWLHCGECSEGDFYLRKWTRKFIANHQLQVTMEKMVTNRTSTPKGYVFLWVSHPPQGMKAWATIDFLATLSPDDNLATRIIAQVPGVYVPGKFKVGTTPVCVVSATPAPTEGEEPSFEPEFEED